VIEDLFSHFFQKFLTLMQSSADSQFVQSEWF
jgi:hypothetical protein